MNSLDITLGGLFFPHLLYHFVLPYSNHEYIEICFSESFESLSRGLQNALWSIGRVPAGHHRTDNLSAATFKGKERREFTESYMRADATLCKWFPQRISRANPMRTGMWSNPTIGSRRG